MDGSLHQVSPSMGFSRQEHWSGSTFPSPGDLPHSGIKPGSPAMQADALPSEPPGKLAILISDKTDFKTKAVRRNLELIQFQLIFCGCLNLEVHPRLWWQSLIIDEKNHKKDLKEEEGRECIQPEKTRPQCHMDTEAEHMTLQFLLAALMK